LNQKLHTFPVEQFPLNDFPSVNLGGPENARGYRSDLFNERKSINAMFLGDSWTEGTGVEFEETYSKRVTDKLSDRYDRAANNWNLGVRGASYDYIARTLMLSLDILKPDIVFITFPVMDRREYFSVEGEMVNLSIGTFAAIERGDASPSPIVRVIYRHWGGLYSPTNDTAQAIMNYKFIESMLTQRNIMWGFSTNDWSPCPAIVEELVKYGLFDAGHYLGNCFQKLGQISDIDGHPDVESHENYSGQIVAWLEMRYGARLKELTGTDNENSL